MLHHNTLPFRLASYLLLFLLPLQIAAQSKGADQSAALDARVKKELASFKGRVGIYAVNLDTGARYGFRADEPVRTASTIKLPIMIEAFAQVAANRVKWADEVVMTKEKKVSGSGVLKDLGDEVRLTLRDAVVLMMTLSDNTATNLALDVLTTDAVNDRMDAMGLKETRLLRKIGGGGVSRAGSIKENERFGLGRTTPREMVAMIERLERGEVVSADASREMLAIMRREQPRLGIGRTVNGVEMATKSGALDKLRSNVGVLYTARGRVAMAITCDDMPEVIWTADNPGHLLMSRLSLILIDGLGKRP